jgi:hypothetical protein
MANAATRTTTAATIPDKTTVGHQSLHGETGQLPQPAEVLEVGGEGAETTLGQERPQPGLDRGAVAQ